MDQLRSRSQSANASLKQLQGFLPLVAGYLNPRSGGPAVGRSPALRLTGSTAAAGLGKLLLYVIILMNIKSLPLFWHVRVFRPFLRFKLSQLFIRIRSLILFRSKRGRILDEDRWIENMLRARLGQDPFTAVTSRYRSRATIDECDYRLHLSNSSYPKIVDCARFKIAVETCPQFLRVGGHIALAATHFYFIREIPVLAPYEIHLSLGSWDHKWIYALCRFYTKNKSSKSKSKSKSNSTSNSQTLNQSGTVETLTSQLVQGQPGNGTEESEYTLHTVSISVCCFKIGRITIPPNLVWAIDGMSSLSSSSSTSAPPHWPQVHSLVHSSHGGSVQKMRKFLTGGWREVPEQERWWDNAMKGVEEERVRKLGLVENLRSAMDGARVFEPSIDT
ncbi:hypothetical protein D9758_004223 [Tetrapyrgos nigripes]|uniref:Uncharacterized protein n=1 Tax=Tetrapyrgos nigripes TaxID=182062 RepID=A0A8H5GU83_9AGAR|nr:hypothetical protein D9758_004223 [Tetrapyrgos nigripes]